MTDRVITYPLSGVQDTDLLRMQVYQRRALHYLARMVLSPQADAGIVWNFVPQAVTGYVVTFSDGGIFGPNIAEDATSFGSLDPAPYGNTPVAVSPATTALTFSGPSSSGNSVIHVVYAMTGQLDTDGEILYYLNTDNPNQVFRGVNNSNQSQPTTRKDLVTLAIAVGTEAATGTQTMPAVPLNAIPMYSVLVRGTSNVIDLNDIAQHPASPFFPGFEQIWGGNPNGHAAGINSKANMPPSMCYDYVNNIHYTCTQSGTKETAVWTAPAVNTGPAGTPGIGLIGLDIRDTNQLYATYTNGVVQDCGTIPAGPPGIPGTPGPVGLYSGTLIQSAIIQPDGGGLYTLNPNTNKVRITAVGAGGAGGGSVINAYSGGGGGAGATCIIDMLILQQTDALRPAFSFYVGRGGVPGQVGLGGSVGSDTVISVGAVEVCRARSGQGGNVRIGASFTSGGLGGVGTISNSYPYDINIAVSRKLTLEGGDGGDGQSAAVNGITQLGGNGGASSLGGAGRAGQGGGLSGKAFTGGGGGASYASTAVGGYGGDGVIFIDEYH